MTPPDHVREYINIDIASLIQLRENLPRILDKGESAVEELELYLMFSVVVSSIGGVLIV